MLESIRVNKSSPTYLYLLSNLWRYHMWKRFPHFWPFVLVRWIPFTKGQPCHVDVIKWKHFPRYWPFVRRIHRSPVNSPHKCQWRGALMFSLICAWINGWINNREAGDLGRHRGHYDVTVMRNFVVAFVAKHGQAFKQTEELLLIWDVVTSQ